MPITDSGVVILSRCPSQTVVWLSCQGPHHRQWCGYPVKVPITDSGVVILQTSFYFVGGVYGKSRVPGQNDEAENTSRDCSECRLQVEKRQECEALLVTVM